jgi:hypothetical protein
MSSSSICRPDLDRGGRIVGMIGVDHNRHRVTDGSADRLAKLDVLVYAKAEFELDCFKAHLGALLGLFDQIRCWIPIALAVEPRG